MSPFDAAAATAALDRLLIDRRARSAAFAGGELYLSAREFDLLAALVRDPTRIVTYEELIDEVFAGAAGVSRRVVDANAARLRRKLDLRGAPGLLARRQGVGFCLLAPECHRAGQPGEDAAERPNRLEKRA